MDGRLCIIGLDDATTAGDQGFGDRPAQQRLIVDDQDEYGAVVHIDRRARFVPTMHLSGVRPSAGERAAERDDFPHALRSYPVSPYAA
jgi:hypothetical protein